MNEVRVKEFLPGDGAHAPRVVMTGGGKEVTAVKCPGGDVVLSAAFGGGMHFPPNKKQYIDFAAAELERQGV